MLADVSQVSQRAPGTMVEILHANQPLFGNRLPAQDVAHLTCWVARNRHHRCLAGVEQSQAGPQGERQRVLQPAAEQPAQEATLFGLHRALELLAHAGIGAFASGVPTFGEQ